MARDKAWNGQVHWSSIDSGEGRIILDYSGLLRRHYRCGSLTQARLAVADLLIELANGKGASATRWIEENFQETNAFWEDK